MGQLVLWNCWIDDLNTMPACHDGSRKREEGRWRKRRRGGRTAAWSTFHRKKWRKKRRRRIACEKPIVQLSSAVPGCWPGRRILFYSPFGNGKFWMKRFCTFCLFGHKWFLLSALPVQHGSQWGAVFSDLITFKGGRDFYVVFTWYILVHTSLFLLLLNLVSRLKTSIQPWRIHLTLVCTEVLCSLCMNTCSIERQDYKVKSCRLGACHDLGTGNNAEILVTTVEKLDRNFWKTCDWRMLYYLKYLTEMHTFW